MIQPYRPQMDLLGPEHAGVRLTAAEFEAAEHADGYRFELIGGVLEVSPSPSPYAQDIAVAVLHLLHNHRDSQGRRVFAHVTTDPRVFVSEVADATTNPQPDVAAYAEYPPKPVTSYRGVFPMLVVEVVTPKRREKDYVRNRALYGDVPAILEYWIVDPVKNLARPSMAIHRRDDGHAPFERIDVPEGGVYEPERWPGLKIDLARIALD